MPSQVNDGSVRMRMRDRGEGVGVAQDEQQAREDEGSGRGEEAGVPQRLRAQASERRGALAESQRGEQADSGEDSVGRQAQRAEAKHAGGQQGRGLQREAHQL